MAIGQAEGEDKARRAIVQALNHPLMDSISLDAAKGLIVNFSGGEELGFFELSSALNYIHTMAGEDVDVVMGVTNDNRLQDRVQVIMVVTGLGAPTLEEVLPGAEQAFQSNSLKPVEEQEKQTAKPVPIPFSREPEPVMASTANDLDLPAFMRRRQRYAEETLQHQFMEQEQ